jgi:pseudouridine-5'-phosphate glycosidase
MCRVPDADASPPDELAGRRAVGSKADLIKQVEVLNRVIENMETQHVTFLTFNGRVLHPDWCRECRVSVLLTLLWTQMRAMAAMAAAYERLLSER